MVLAFTLSNTYKRLGLLRRFAAARVAVAAVALAGLAGFFGVMLVVLRQRAIEVNFRLKLAVLVAAHVALIVGVGLN